MRNLLQREKDPYFQLAAIGVFCMVPEQEIYEVFDSLEFPKYGQHL